MAAPADPLAKAVGSAALATSDFAAQLAYIKERLPIDEDARSRARLIPKCQVRWPPEPPHILPHAEA